VTSDLFAIYDEVGQLAAVCGYEHWPARIAHLCVATAPQYRRRGAGRKVSEAAIASAVAEGLLPQWRARPEASKMLARSLGFEELGLQMSVRLA
jgi:ribosomal protein S18 acetylase RimI-like enzyme